MSLKSIGEHTAAWVGVFDHTGQNSSRTCAARHYEALGTRPTEVSTLQASGEVPRPFSQIECTLYSHLGQSRSSIHEESRSMRCKTDEKRSHRPLSLLPFDTSMQPHPTILQIPTVMPTQTTGSRNMKVSEETCTSLDSREIYESAREQERGEEVSERDEREKS